MATRHEDEEDMTMEEILASIRRYVADDKPTSQGRSQGGAKVSEFKSTKEDQPITNTIVVEPNSEKTETQYQGEWDNQDEDVIFDLTDPVEEGHISFSQSRSDSKPEPKPEAAPRPQVAPEPRQRHQRADQSSTPYATPQTQSSVKEREMQRVPPDDPMTSAQTMQASLSALSRLTEAKRSASEWSSGAGSVTLDRLVADIARPIIKEWLEKNLAPMIEKMVAKEIERITREISR